MGRDGPRTRAEVRAEIAARWPDHDPDSLSYAASYLVPVVQVPPRGLWGETGPATLTTVGAWLGEDAAGAPDPAALVLRYLGAFGPASVADVRTWSGLTGVRELVEPLRPRLRTFRDAAGVELFDLPDAPRPDPDTPARPRFLPEYDNLLLSHADRSRVIPDGRRVPLPPGNGAAVGTVLIDGDWRATWHLDRPSRLVVDPFTPLTRAERPAVESEALRLLTFLTPDATTPDVRISPAA